VQSGEALIEQVMGSGRRLRALPALEASRKRARAQLARLPAALQALEDAAASYPVEFAPSLQALAAAVDAVTEGRAGA
jgi:hypothetical protein